MYLALLTKGTSYLALYTLQILIVGYVLFAYRKKYRSEITPSFSILPIIAGVAVFLIWIGLEGHFPQLGESKINRFNLENKYMLGYLLTIRLIGSSFVVPLMEELFWRSFCLRYFISNEFKKVPIGQFTWVSFAITSIAFGFEHYRWLPGILAGIIYAGVLYKRKNLFDPIIAHTVTNFLLGWYVISTENYGYW